MPHDVHERQTSEPAHVSPDEEAMLLMTKVLERALVAKSFAKLASALLTVGAAQASVQLRAAADAKLSEMKKVARAAAEAARHVATKRPVPDADDIPETQDAPVTSQAAE